MFKSLVNLTNHLTNIIALSYTLSAFRISIVRYSNVIVLLCTAETERVQYLMRTLARTNPA